VIIKNYRISQDKGECKFAKTIFEGKQARKYLNNLPQTLFKKILLKTGLNEVFLSNFNDV